MRQFHGSVGSEPATDQLALGPQRSETWDDVRLLQARPRRPCCCVRCCGCNVRSVVAEFAELQKLLLTMESLMLKDDMVICGELFQRGSHLIRVGRRWRRRGYWERGQDTEDRCTNLIRELIKEEGSTKLTFQCPAVHLPWCIVLNFPCSVFLLTIAAIGGLCASGITGSLTIDTDTNSFLDSDSQSSLDYNAFLDAIKANSGQRRLLSSQTAQWSWRDPWRSIRELEDEPVFDQNGKWHPFRHLTRGIVVDELLGEGRFSGTPQRRLQYPLPLFQEKKASVIYATKKKGNILSNGLLSKIRGIEEKLRGLPEFQTVCQGAEAHRIAFCDPGISMVSWAFPERVQQGQFTTLFFNGSGSSSLPLEIAVDYAKKWNLLRVMFPQSQANAQKYDVEALPCGDSASDCAQLAQDGQCQPSAKHETYMRGFCAKTCAFCGAGPAYPATSAPAEVINNIRTFFHFLPYCCMSNENSAGGRARVKKAWENFVAKFVEMMSQLEDADLHVFYSGDNVESYEALQAVRSDLLWAIGSYSFVLFYATLHTRSIFLSTLGLILVLLSIPSALAIFAHASGSEEISLMSCLSIFIVIGIGSDMLFVYTDFWKQSVTHSRDPAKRLKFTYVQAGTSTAATTFTTAMSFLANLASVLRPLREFGFFMGACVIMAWIIMFLGYPPVLIIGECIHRRVREKCVRRRTPVVEADPALPVRKTTDGSTSALSIESHLSHASAKTTRTSISTAFASMLDPEKKGVGELHGAFLGMRFAGFLRDWKCSVSLLFLLITASSGFFGIRNLKQAKGVPQIFPSDHNQVLGKEYMDKYQTVSDLLQFLPNYHVTECQDLFGVCNHFQCETYGRPQGAPFECQCYRQGLKLGFCVNQSRTEVQLRVLAREGLQTASVHQANFKQLMQVQFPNAIDIQLDSSPTAAHKFVADDWESGRKMLTSMFSPGVVKVQHRAVALGEMETTCRESQVCYCAMEKCWDPGAVSANGTLVLHNTSIRRLHHEQSAANPIFGRSLQQATVRSDNMVDVNVIIGLQVTGENPLLGVSSAPSYKFDSGFDLQDPWAQRKLEKLCAEMPNNAALKIMLTRCWLLGFRDAWMATGKDWPLRPNENIHNEVYTYAQQATVDNYPVYSYIWFTSDRRVQGTYLVYFLSVAKDVDLKVALDLRKQWDSYLDEFNMEAKASIKGVWHASNLWVRAEAEKVILDSTIVTLSISLGCVFVGIFLFTRSIHLAFMVIAVVAAIIVCLLFFMTVMMQWHIGPIEILCLIIFVGFAVDYSLHVAHKYHRCHIVKISDEPFEGRVAQDAGTGRATQPVAVQLDDEPPTPERKRTVAKKQHVLLATNRQEERFARTRYALERMGGAVVGSALTTVGCAAFLLPCQLTIFTRIGSVVVAVSVLAIIFTIFPLPALLILCGPCDRDFRNFKSWVYGLANDGGKTVDAPTSRREEVPVCRRYVLHMPTRAVSAVGTAMPATRTKVIATG